jgi:hypothetical protein
MTNPTEHAPIWPILDYCPPDAAGNVVAPKKPERATPGISPPWTKANRIGNMSITQLPSPL